MEKILILILLFNFYQLNAQENIDIVNPPGTIKLNDSLYIDKTPVTNLMFLEYLTAKNFLKKEGYDSFKDYSKTLNADEFPYNYVIIPSPFLKDLNSTNKYLKRRKYYKNLKYQYHPILDISKEQAEDFCKWRTEMVKYLWFNHDKYITNKKIAKKILYRLPSKTELIEANIELTTQKKIAVFNNKNLFNIELQSNIDNFIILPIAEFTESEVLFNNNLNMKLRFKFTGFRCVCENKNYN